MKRMGQTAWSFVNCDSCSKLVQLAGKNHTCHECRRERAKNVNTSSRNLARPSQFAPRGPLGGSRAT